MKQVFLICGADARWLNDERDATIGRFVPREMRDENLLELYATSNRELRLEDVLSQVVSELATIPFLPDSRRVVVVHNLSDFMAGGRSGGARKKGGKKGSAQGESKKRTPVQVLEHFMQHDLPATGNVLIFASLIEYDRGRYLDTNAALYKALQKSEIAQIVQPRGREQDPLFSMSDAILDRRTAEALRHFRSIYGEATKTRVFGELLKLVRFLIQADLVTRLEGGGMPQERIELRYMPDDKRLSYLSQAQWLRDKYARSAARFKLTELMAALDQLLEIHRALFPTARDRHVPDERMLIETFIIQFCEGAMRKTA